MPLKKQILMPKFLYFSFNLYNSLGNFTLKILTHVIKFIIKVSFFNTLARLAHLAESKYSCERLHTFKFLKPSNGIAVEQN